MRNNYWLLLVLGFALSCTQTTKQSGGNQAGQRNTGLAFAFSKQASMQGVGSAENWCHAPQRDAAVISADPANFNRRLFTLSDGPHKVTVDFGNIVAAFILKKSGNQVEIFTSDNFPECLSNHSNFTIGADGTTFHYDNLKHISFDVQLILLPNGTQIALEMAPDAGYGMIVRR